MVASSLKSFIKDVRGAKTLADERSIITKQSAKVRTKLRDDHLSNEKKRINIQKLLYLFILGEKTHFGQVESINLIASDKFVDKRLGYLATILLLDESQDLLTLLTNMLNNDLQHPNKYIVALALTTLGCLSSTELARDLYPDVENILSNSNDPYLLKKALQCNAKLIMKDRSLLEIFPIDLIDSKLMSNQVLRTHGVLLGICKVLQSILISFEELFNNTHDHTDENEVEERKQDLSILKKISVLIPQLTARLSALNTKNLEPAYDVQGVQDPFLQCELIVTLKWFFKIGNDLKLEDITNYNDNFSDLLSQISTNTNVTKNPGNAILYEVTKTIFELKSSQPLRVLGINILANFLVTGQSKSTNNGSNNNKYVSLNTLISVVPEEPSAVQRYRKLILQCLYDYDISIKFRALELTFAILNEQNLIELTTELIKFLEKISTSPYNYVTAYVDIDDSKDLIIYTIDHLLNKFELYSTKEEKSKLDNLTKILKLVGNFIDLDRVNEFLIAINNIGNLDYKISKFGEELSIILDEKNEQNSLDDNIGLQLVMIWCIGEYADLILAHATTKKSVVNEKSLVEFLTKMNEYHRLSNDTRMVHYILTAAVKVSTKIADGQYMENLRQIILSHSKDSDLMIQTKSIQYELIFNQPVSVKKLILQVMPKFERKVISEEPAKSSKTLEVKQRTERTNDLLLDLLNDTDAAQIPKPKVTSSTLLSDLLAGSNNNDSAKGKPTVAAQLNTIALPSDASLIHDGIEIEVSEKIIDISPGLAHLELYIRAKRSDLANVQPLCAVPKTQKLTLSQLQPSSHINKMSISKQTLKITGSGKLKLRIKISFQKDGNPNSESEQFDYKLDKSI